MHIMSPLEPSCRWDAYHSANSNPLEEIKDVAREIGPVHAIQIPRWVWDALKIHPRVMLAHDTLPIVKSPSERCPTCGSIPVTYRPALDSAQFSLILGANVDGPILPNAVVLTDITDNAVTLQGRTVAVIRDVLDETNTERYGVRT